MSRKLNVFVAGMWHETNTFSPVLADIREFEAYQSHSESDLLTYFEGSNTEIGGFLNAAVRCNFDITPGGYFAAVPSGPVTLAAFIKYSGEIMRCIESAPKIEAIYLSLHGAMVLEDGSSGDANLLQAIKTRWPSLPLVATFDLHANLSNEAIASADLLIGYDTFPHADFFERGQEAALLTRQIVDNQTLPEKAFRRLPLITVPQKQGTSDEPLKSIFKRVHELEKDPGVWTCSVVPGFAYADVAHLGFTILAYGSAKAVEKAVDEIAHMAWDSRREFVPELTELDDAIRRVKSLPTLQRPVILVEPADNVGGGAPGDATHILAALVSQNIGPSVAVIWDKLAVDAAWAVGAGGRLQVAVGAHSTALSGTPVLLDGTVLRCDTPTYTRTGSYMTGQQVSMGRTAVILNGLVTIVLTSERVMPFDSDHLTCLGIRLDEMRVLTVKSGSAWRAAFEDVISSAIYVDTPGVGASNVKRLPYKNLQGRYFPLDEFEELEAWSLSYDN